MFLFKPSCWAYEEEVRVAKCLKGIETNSSIKSGDFCTIEVSGRPLHLFQLPAGVIKEIYIGARASELTQTAALELVRNIREYQQNVEIYGCAVSRTSWSLEAFNLELSAN